MENLDETKINQKSLKYFKKNYKSINILIKIDI